ncbi:MAG: hypothetical protein MZW92_27970 [Comamonadaceae bacterium]|nr:hypothetical protein [Comamonadaceae bacterium]
MAEHTPIVWRAIGCSMPPLHEDELSVFRIKSGCSKHYLPAVVLMGIPAEREIGCKWAEGYARPPRTILPVDPDDLVHALMPDLLQLVFQKLDSEFAFGGVEPVGVGLARLLSPAFDHAHDCAIRQDWRLLLSRASAKLRAGRQLDLFAINEDSQINSPASPSLPLL